jgi:hypothetical protein
MPIPVSTIDGNEVARRIGLTKHLKYVNEIEYRLVACEGFSEEIKMIDSQHGEFEPRHILGATVGENMPPKQIDKVRSMCVRRNPPIPLFMASRRPGCIRIMLL